jgi:hypothetical protein
MTGRMAKHLPSKQSEVVERVPLLAPPVGIRLPGHDGSRPRLSFVLKTLAGDDSGMTKDHFDIRPNFVTPELEDEWKRLIKIRHKALGWAEENMIAMMRHLADLWIDSGKDVDAYTPSERNVEYRPSDGSPSIADSFSALEAMEAHYPIIRRDGTQDTKRLSFGIDLSHSRMFGPESAARRLGAKVAMHYFARLLDSPHSINLARCDSCQSYFGYERAPAKTIKRGVRCPNCKPKGSAVSKKAAREQKRSAMVKAAAEVWDRWTKSNRNNLDMYEWVSRQVNKGCGTSIQRKWVVQNEKSILRRMEELQNAKG